MPIVLRTTFRKPPPPPPVFPLRRPSPTDRGWVNRSTGFGTSPTATPPESDRHIGRGVPSAPPPPPRGCPRTTFPDPSSAGPNWASPGQCRPRSPHGAVGRRGPPPRADTTGPARSRPQRVCARPALRCTEQGEPAADEQALGTSTDGIGGGVTGSDGPPPPPRDALEGGRELPSSRASSLCPATVPLTPSASFNGICTRQ